jgi:hypothetical protein
MNMQCLSSARRQFRPLATFQQSAWLTISLALGSMQSRPVLAQGCVPAHYISLSLGARGIDYLEPHGWEGDVSFRYLHSETVYRGTQEQPQLHELGGRNSVYSIDLRATYAITTRFDISLTLPFEHDDFSLPQGDGQRHGGSTTGVGDMRLILSSWLFDPATHSKGNVGIGLGVKFPTGDDRATADWHNGDGSISKRPVDIAAQLGDGGFGAVLEVQGFEQIVPRLFGYVSGFYLLNPRDVNSTETASPVSPHVNSVPDQYLGRAGFSYVILPSAGLAASLGGRIDGIPTHDLVGGSDGFRRAGYAVYVDPGINWTAGRNTFSLNVPVAVERNLEATRFNSVGAFADFILVAGYSVRF